jgi:hypothetical protein
MQCNQFLLIGEISYENVLHEGSTFFLDVFIDAEKMKVSGNQNSLNARFS